MAIKYKAVSQSKPGIKGGANYQYYARITGRTKFDIHNVCKDLSLISTLSDADIIAVVYGFLDRLPDYLINGYNVQLGDFGTFSLSLSSEAAESEEKLTSRNIKKVNIHFRPGVRFKKAVSNPKFVKV